MRAIAILVFFFCGSAWTWAQPVTESFLEVVGQPPAEQPQENDPYTWDFGQAKEGDVVKHDFDIANRTDKTVTIGAITTSCGCTASAAQKKVLQPGESTKVNVSFKTKKYKGAVTQFVYVTTDNPGESVIKLTLKGEVIP